MKFIKFYQADTAVNPPVYICLQSITSVHVYGLNTAIYTLGGFEIYVQGSIDTIMAQINAANVPS